MADGIVVCRESDVTVFEFYAAHNQIQQNPFYNAVLILSVTLLVGFLGLFLPKAQATLSRRDIFGDFVMMLLVKFGLVGLFFLLPGATQPRQLGLYPLASFLTLPAPFALLLYLIIRDLGQWFKHVALHKIPFLWAFHQVHHANASLSIFANYRLHVVEIFLGSVVTLATLFITGYPLEYAFIAISFEEGVSMLNHSNLRLSYGRFFSKVFTSPQNHRIHHSKEHLRLGKEAYNFAILFPLWDLFFGSYFSDRKVYPAATGVDGEERLEKAGLVGRQWLGFRNAVKALK